MMLSILLCFSQSAPIHTKKRAKIVKNDYKVGVVTCNSLNVRNEPNGDIIGHVEQGDIIKIVDGVGTWYQIEYKNSYKAYVYSQYVKIINDFNRRKEVVEFASSLIGSGYHDGDRGPDIFDKPGLVFYTYAQKGFNIPSSTSEMYNSRMAEIVPSKCELPADVVFFSTSISSSTPAMVGIYIGNHKFIWADVSDGVCVKEMKDYSDYYLGARRFI